MTQRMYGRSGKYTQEEWQGVIAEQQHKANVHTAMQPQKEAIDADMASQLGSLGVAAEKITALTKMIKTGRLERIQWSSVAMKQAVLAIRAWYEAAMEPITMDQIERNNVICQWGK